MITVTGVTSDRIGPLGNHGDHRRCSPVGAAIGTIGASRSSERGIVGTGRLLEAREDQRSKAIVIPPGPNPSPLRKLPLPPGLGRKLGVFLAVPGLQAVEAVGIALAAGAPAD